MKAILYARVSGEAQQENTSLESQIAACTAKAEALGAQIVGQYAEVDSGRFYLSRSMIQEALKRLEEGEADALIMMRLDRTGRGVVPLLDIKERVEEAGAQMIFADGLSFPQNAIGRFLYTNVAGVAELERGLISERMVAGKRAAASERGEQPFGSKDPPGYHVVTKDDIIRGTYPPAMKRRYVVKEEERHLPQQIFERYAKGDGIVAVARWLLTVDSSRKWYPATVFKVLKNPLYIGEPRVFTTRTRTLETRTSRGTRQVRKRAAPDENHITLSCEPLVSRELFDRVQKRLQENKDNTGSRENKRLLSGLIVCPDCGRRMRGHAKSYTMHRRGKSQHYSYRYYHCKRNQPSASHDGQVCNKTQYHAEPLEEAVLETLRTWLSSDRALVTACESNEREKRARHKSSDAQAQLVAARKEFTQAQANMNATMDAQIEGSKAGLSFSLYEPRLKEAAARLEASRARVEKLEADIAARGIVPGLSTKEAARQQALAIRHALDGFENDLFSDELPTHAKNALLTRIIERIVPAPDYTVRIYPRALQASV